MKTNGREDSGRHGIVLGSDVVLKIDPQASFSAAVEELTAEAIDTSRKTDQSVVVSTARSSERTLLALVDGQRTVQELVRLAGMSDLVVRRHLRSLCERGILVPADPTASAPPEAPSDSAVPERTTSESSGMSGDGLSRALAAYLDSGKTAVVQAPAPDAVTVKATGTPGAPGVVPAPSSAGDVSTAKVVVVGGGARDGSGGTAAGPPSDPRGGETAAGRRAPSPPSGVVAGEWPRRSNTPSSFKPNVTAFWFPSAGEASAGAGSAGASGSANPGASTPSAPAAPAAGVGPASAGTPAASSSSPARTATPPGSPPVSPTGAPGSSPPASVSVSSSPSSPSGSPATTMMWPRPPEGALKPARPVSSEPANVIVTVGSPSAPAAPPIDFAPPSPAVMSAPPPPGTTFPEGVPSALGGGSGRSRNAAIPFRLGEYEVATRIAQGGMGSIYVCRRAGATGVQRLFTLKVVRQHAKQITQVVQSFRREARVGALLSHPNLQTVVHVGTYHEQPFLILDYVEGIGLAELLASQKRLPPAIVVSILVDVLRGLKVAHDLVDEQGHRLGLVHGDISPQNVLIGVDGSARLTDFGSARFSSDARVTDVGPLVGKPAFMAPEQLSADPLDARTDLFSLGVVMWTALTGQSLFVADSYEQIVMNVFRKKIPPPSEFGAPACFDEIATTALSRAPEGRYSNAEEMANALSRVARAEGIVGSPYDVGQWVRREFAETLAERRRRVQVVFGGGGAAVGVGGAPPAAAGAAGATVGGDTAVVPSLDRPGDTTADGYPRLPSRTIQIPAMPRRRSTPRLKSLDGDGEEAPRWTRARVVALSAAISFPFALALAYLVTNPIARRVRQGRAAVPASVESGGGLAIPSTASASEPSPPPGTLPQAAPPPRAAAERSPPPAGARLPTPTPAPVSAAPAPPPAPSVPSPSEPALEAPPTPPR